MLKNSGLINGRESVFVVPAAMPVAMDAIPKSFGDRQVGWGQIAVTMVTELNGVHVDEPVHKNNEGAGCKRDNSLPRGDDGNPYKWADKDFGWQQGGS